MEPIDNNKQERTAQMQRKVLEHLAESGNVSYACKRAGINRDRWLQQLSADPAMKERFFRHSLGENQNPTDSGRLFSDISLRVVLSIAAMWSASKACRIPSVYAVMPSPKPKTCLSTV